MLRIGIYIEKHLLIELQHIAKNNQLSDELKE